MSWLNALYETYDSNLSRIGEDEIRFGREFTLMPISHTTQTAQLEVTVTEKGDFHSVKVLDKISTLIPVSESSASRSGSKIAPHPLHDKLNYVAGDLVNYGGEKKEQEQFDAYIKQLGEWVAFDSTNHHLKAIYDYLSKKELIKDLVEEGILILDNGKIVEKWSEKLKKEKGPAPEVYSKVADKVSSAFVRFSVRSIAEEIQSDLWKDEGIQQSFIKYYDQFLNEADICFVTGKKLPITERHAKKIRYSADNAKLISSNNDFGFTFKGRFKVSRDSAIISYEVSQKAHNALKWLINRQGRMINGRVFLFWGNEKLDIVSPMDDFFNYLLQEEQEEVEREVKSNTFQEYAEMIQKSFMGFKQDLSFTSEINILVLDAATPGRMNVQYYRNMNKELYLKQLENWHKECVWLHRYHKKEGKHVEYFGSPSIQDITQAIYGTRANERVLNDALEQLLPCILDGRSVPKPFLRLLAQRASNPHGMEKWEWKKTVSVACAVINREERGYTMALNTESTNRSYLFGRLLALANELEKWSLREQGEKNDKRETNAERYMVSFSNKPKRTWGVIYHNLQPYQARLGKKADRLNHLMLEVMDQFSEEDFNDKALDPVYLLGYSSQIIANEKHVREITNKKENEE